MMIGAQSVEEIATSPRVVALVIGVIVIAAAAGVRWALRKTFARATGSSSFGTQVGRFAGAAVFVIGAVYALSVAGIKVGPLLGALGVGGIAVAFAAQDILQNMVAGLLIQLRRPFRVGDQISAVDYEGTVHDIDFRVVKLHTYDGLDVALPNAEVLRGAITNHTRTPYRRTTLPVGVAYDTDLDMARNVISDTLRSVEGVAPSPPPQALVREFADSSIVIDALYWHRSDMASVIQARNDAAVAIKKALDAQNIEIAFPQRVVWLKQDTPEPPG